MTTVLGRGYRTPSYANGYARNAEQAMYPELWDGLVGAWMPILGKNGQLYDISGRGNHAVLPGGTANPTWGVGQFGPQMEFDGINDVLLLPSNLNSILNNDFSLILSIQTLSASADGGFFGRGDGSDAAGALQFWRDENGATDRIGIAIYSGGAYQVQYGSYNPDLVNQHIYVWTHTDGGLNNLYVDGVNYINNWSQTIPNATLTPRLGNTIANTGQKPLNGEIAFSIVHNRALIPTEIRLLTSDPWALIRRRRNVRRRYIAAAAPSTFIPRVMVY